jgi:hypothetical protein
MLQGFLGDPTPPLDEKTEFLYKNGLPRLGTVITPYDPERHKETYKVFSHLYDFAGSTPLTKGVGGFDGHQRGICIGWRSTRTKQAEYDSWHMIGCAQCAKAETLRESTTALGLPQHSIEIAWRDMRGETFIRETRRLALLPDEDGIRLFEFESILESTVGDILLSGDHHHSGVHVRLANEVCRKPWTVRFEIPRNARWGHDQSVLGGWWIHCRFLVRGKKYSLLHITPPGSLVEPPTYSAREYGKIGAFFTKTLKQGEPFHIRCRLALSENPLSQDVCEHFCKQSVKAEESAK